MAKIVLDVTQPQDTDAVSVLGASDRSIKAAINSMMDEIYSRLDAIDGGVASGNGVADLITRLDALDGGTEAAAGHTVQTLKQAIDALSDPTTGSVTDLIARLDAIDEGTASTFTLATVKNTADTAKSDLDTETTGVKARVSALETTIGANDTEGLRKRIADNETAISNISQDITPPVGTVITLDTLTTPTDLGYSGTWARFAMGRSLVGLNNHSFAAAEKDDTLSQRLLADKAGEEKVTLEVNHLPEHDHNIPELTTSSQPIEHGGNYERYFSFTHQHSGKDYSNSTKYSMVTQQGGDEGHNNMMPYQVVCYWKRTA